MPKAVRKHYAICIGRKGPQVVDNWEECKSQVSRFPGAIHRSFTSRADAEAWLTNEIRVRGDTTPKSLRKAAECHIPPELVTVQEKDEKIQEKPSNLQSTSEGIVLSPEQQYVLNTVKEGRSVFFTGSAGTGKSVLLREIISWVWSSNKSLGITASTGIAAVNIGGYTLHSWGGIGLGDQKVANYVGKFFAVPKFEPILRRWQNVDILIIDEISMVDGELFDKMEQIARGVRRNNHPFGGIQLVLSGDFFQLPPVSRTSDVKFAFEAMQWDACVGAPVFLSRVYRQKNQTLIDMLNAMRFGKLDIRMIQGFKNLARKVTYTDGIEPTELYPTRNEVNNSNSLRLKQLDGQQQSYPASDWAGFDAYGQRVTEQQLEKILDRLVVPKFIQLKVGAQVMLVKNLIQGVLVNGSVGQVTRFCKVSEARRDSIETPVIKENKGPPDDSRTWPVVRFIGGREILCVPQEFTVQNANEGVEASRHQVPLILAWALSVHKSQGQTLERVKVDLRKTFEKGQAYVALSRATRLDQLEVLNFEAAKVQAHPRVTAWHTSHAPPLLQEKAPDLPDSESDDDEMPHPSVAFFR